MFCVAIEAIYQDIKNKRFWKMFKKNGKEFVSGTFWIIVTVIVFFCLALSIGWLGNLTISLFK